MDFFWPGPGRMRLSDSVGMKAMRAMLDPAEPKLLYPIFAETIATLESIPDGLDAFRRRDKHVLIGPGRNRISLFPEDPQ
jgi:hypothetical protein